MRIAPIPADEVKRLTALRRLGILDTTPEERYDRLVRLAAAALQTPIALISLIDDNRQWFKARVGLDVEETHRDLAFCAHAIGEDGLFVVQNACADPRFRDNPLVTGQPDIVFYAGQVVRDPEGFPVGTICAIDRVARDITAEQRDVLRDLAALVEAEFASSQREKLIEKLERSELHKLAVLDNLTDGLVVQDSSGAVVEWNVAATKLLGLSDEELSGRSSYDPRWRSIHVDGSPWPGDDHPAMQAQRTGRHIRAATMGVHRPDGSLVWLHVNARPLIDRFGHTTGSVTLFGDIAGTFDATKASESTTLRLRQAIDSSGIGTALLDDTGATTFVNQAFVDIVGLTHDRLLGLPSSVWVHPADPRHANGILSGASMSTLIVDVQVAPQNHGAAWVRCHIAKLVNEASSADQFIVQLVDITEQRSLQQTVRRSERIARASLDSLEQGILVVDETAVVYQGNTVAGQILGFTSAEITERFRSGQWETYDEHGAVLPKHKRPVRRAMDSGQPVHGALLGWRHKDGRLLLLRVSCVPVSLEEGEPRVFVVAFADVTDQFRDRKLLDATFATAPVGLAVVEDDRLIRWNPTFALHTDQGENSLLGGNITALLGTSNGSSIDDGAEDSTSERLITTLSGKQKWLDTRHAHIDDLDRPLDIVATFDVTERKRLELDLQRFGHLFRNSQDVITVVDATGQIMHASPSSERLLGYTKDSRLPGGVLDLVHPDDLTEAAARFGELFNGDRGDEPFTIRLKTIFGVWKHIETVGTNLLHEPSVNGIVLTSRDVTDRQLLTDELAHRATHDALTDLANRAAVEERLLNSLARVRRHGEHVGVCFIDLDKFKRVNDTLGHAAGDAVLVEVASRLNTIVRESDLAARLGGDEFVIVLDLVPDAPTSILAATRIHEFLNDPPIRAGGLKVPISMGVAISHPDDTPSTLLSRADAALYEAKAAGTSGIVAASTALPG